MTMTSFKQTFVAWRRAEQGNVAMMTGIVLLVVLTAIGAALDYGQMTKASRNLQNALDSGVLATASRGSGTTAEMESYGIGVASDNATSLLGVGTPTFEIKIDDAGAVNGVARIDYKPLWAGFVGSDSHPISVDSQSFTQHSAQAEIAFVLDYSSSMNSQYVAMKNAAISLINDLVETSPNGISFGLVPFAEEVYLQVDGKYIVGGSRGVLWEGCTMSRKWPFVISDRTPNGNADSQWGHRGSNCSAYPSRDLVVRPLDEDYEAVKRQLNNMRPHAGTNTTVGAEIGYQMLSPNAPFDAAPYGAKQKFLVILSDGEQTRASYGPGDRFTTAQAASNLQALCQAATNDGIKVVTILYQTTDSAARTAMRNCASRPEYFMTANTGNVSERFAAIGDLVKTDIRLSY